VPDFYFIIHFPVELEVRIESTDIIAMSEGQTLTLKCSFDFGIGLLNLNTRIHDDSLFWLGTGT
jgi:hypothetical protein